MKSVETSNLVETWCWTRADLQPYGANFRFKGQS